MRSTDSEEVAATPRYNFTFAWESSYGHVVEVLQRLALEPGLIIDLGCGVASIADPLIDLGYEYVGADIDQDALAHLSQRGIESHRLDLSELDEIPGHMQDLANGRRVAAVLLLDVVEHMPETHPFLSAVRDGLDLLGRPTLIVSVPNVAHIDLAAKLAFGRWDYTATGLLDATHLQLFTSDRLRDLARASGLVELAAHDFTLRSSDQHFPSDHPALSSASPIAATLRMWREAADSHGETIQFVRAYVPANTTRELAEAGVEQTSVDVTPLAVVMRTQGRRPTHLRDALTCLAAQTDDNFNVLLMVHSTRPEVIVPEVTTLVEEFDTTFSSRVTVIPVAGGGRARPLNAALDRLQSRYVAFLDDDDVVTADWVETFVKSGGEGAIVRSVAAVRHLDSLPDESSAVPHLAQSALDFRYAVNFDAIRHLWENETPICTFAVPRNLIDTFKLRFDEQLPILEDWDFLMRCVSVAPVRDTGKVTSIYQMWRTGESSASLHEAEIWRATQRVLQERRSRRPVVLPAGSTEQLVRMCEQLAERDATRKAMSDLHTELQLHGEASKLHADARIQLEEQVKQLRDEIEKLRRAYEITIQSRRWRVLGPPARAVAFVRRVCRNAISRASRLRRRVA